MIARQLRFRTLHGVAQRLLPDFHLSKYARQLFDKSHQSAPTSINRSMLNCMQSNLPSQALHLFSKHLQLGFTHTVDEVTISLALKACRGDPAVGSQIHGFAISSGFTSYLVVSNSLMNMYCKAGFFDRALCIFENMSDPDVVSWNTMLSGFQISEQALNFVRLMNLNGVAFDPVTFTTALAFCSEHQDFFFALQLHSLVVKLGLECEVYVGNALISMYSRRGFLVEAKRVFDEMPIRDSVSWNAMVSGYTQEGNHWLEAICAFVEMVRDGIELDHVSFTGAISACGHARNLDLARQVHSLALKRGYGTHVSVGNVLISTYAKCDLIEDGKRVFYSMTDRNVISWTTMISISEEDAVCLFNEMRLDGVYPNDVTFIGLLHSISTRNLVQEGQKVHAFCIKTNFLSELNVCNSLITMYAKFESMADSRKVFDELNYRETISWNALISGYAQNELHEQAFETFLLAITELQPNQYTFGSVLSAIGSAEALSLRHGQRCHSHLIKVGLNTDPVVSSALLDMYAKRGSINESQRVFHEVPQKGEFSWTAIISAYARHGNYESVINMYNEMEKEGVIPDSITFLSVLTACARKGMVDMGYQLFDSMLNDYHIEPSPEHYSCMVDMLGRAGRLKEAEELLGRIPGGPGLSVLQSLLGSCRIHGDVEMGERMVDALIEMEPMESGSFVLMCNLYAEKGQWEKVAKLRKRMRDKGVRKEIGFSWVDVSNPSGGSLCSHAFSSGDKSHPQSQEIWRMVEFIGMEMKFLRESQQIVDNTELLVPICSKD